MTALDRATARGSREFILQTGAGGGGGAGAGDGAYRVVADRDGQVTECVPVAGVAATGAVRSSLGLVDLQVNGYAGVDFNRTDTTAETLDHALATMLSHGTTRCLPTIITASIEVMAARLAALDAAVERSRLGPWMVMGYHLEGPFLSAEDGYAGCHPKAQMRTAAIEILERLERGLRRPVRLLTVAPEREGVLDLIPKAIDSGKTIAIGHTAATRAQIEAVAAAGARLSTHLGNGIAHLLEKNENPLFAQLGEDRLVASFIADGIHIPPYMLRFYVRAKGLARTILVTDATASAAAAPGLYTLGDVQIEKSSDGVVREPGSPYLGGSSATMDAVLRNAMAWLPATFDEALGLARANPLRLLGEANVPDAGSPLEYVTWRTGNSGPEVVEAGVGPWFVEGTAAG
jgi:N-acetylglucosamine-6-phosphate deacetylase